MTRKQKRLAVIAGGLAILGLAAGLVLYALRDSIVFFYTPSEISEKNVQPGTRLRLGGLVEEGSISKAGGTTVLLATHEAGFVDRLQRGVCELSQGELVRDERHGGYGDTSAIARLAPEPERGAAAVAALTAVQSVQAAGGSVHYHAVDLRDADAVYTDVWTSMGQEAEKSARDEAFRAYQLNAELMRHAKSKAVAMHCLPAHRGQEIADEVIDGPQSVIFPQAENRLHTQRALLEILMDR